jgi:hypothetical protein
MVMPRQHVVQKKGTQKCLGFFLQCCPDAYSEYVWMSVSLDTVELLQSVVVSSGCRVASDIAEVGCTEFHQEDQPRLHCQGERLGLLVFHDLGGMRPTIG